MNNKTLGQFIAENRKEKGLTQRELSEMLQVSDKTISHWERDESSPDITILPELSAIFGITVDELLKKEKNPPPCAEVIPPQSENDMKEKEKDEKRKKQARNNLAFSLGVRRRLPTNLQNLCRVGSIPTTPAKVFKVVF